MSGTNFATDFSALFELLSKGRQLSASRLLARINDPEVISGDDEKLVRSTMNTIKGDMQAVQAAMKDIMELHTFFSAQLKDLGLKLSDYKSLVAPIRRLPVEILQEIFLYVESTKLSVFERRRNPPPVTAQINRHWRLVALDTPSLWATSVVTLGNRRFASQAKALKLRMARSEPLPVSLVIRTITTEMPLSYGDGYYVEDDIREDDLEDPEEYEAYFDEVEVFEREQRRARREAQLDKLVLHLNSIVGKLVEAAVVPYLHRLGSIKILQYSDAFQHLLDSLKAVDVASSLPQLKFLAVPGETWASNSTLPFNTAPNLERLFIDSSALRNPVGPSAQWKGIPWAELKAFRGPLPQGELAALFSPGSEKLQLAEIWVRHVLPRSPQGNTMYSPLQNLTSLYLRAITIPQTSSSFPPLPALRHLLFQPDNLDSYASFNPPTRNRVDIRPHVVALAKAWGPQLEYFGLDLSTMASSDLIAASSIDEIVASTPNLEALGLPSSWAGELGRIVPRLKHLSHLEIFSTIKAPDHRFLHGTVQTKEWSPETLSKLRTLTFLEHYSGSEYVTMRDAENKAKDNGLSIAISHGQIRPTTRFCSPYFIQKGGLYAQCLADEDAREQVIQALGRTTYY